MKLKTLFKIIYPFIIFLIILFFLYKSTKNGDLINSLKAINIKIIFMVIVIFFIIKIVNTFRYAKLYNLQPSLKLFVLLCYSNMMLSLIPYRLGELSYVHGFKKYFNKDYSEATRKLITLRIIDYLFVYILLLISSL